MRPVGDPSSTRRFRRFFQNANGHTDGRTDIRTDRLFYRDARTHLKSHPPSYWPWMQEGAQWIYGSKKQSQFSSLKRLFFSRSSKRRWMGLRFTVCLFVSRFKTVLDIAKNRRIFLFLFWVKGDRLRFASLPLDEKKSFYIIEDLLKLKYFYFFVHVKFSTSSSFFFL